MSAALAVALTLASAAFAAAAGTYTGTTTQSAPIKLKVGKSRKNVSISVRYTAPCGDGTSISDSTRGSAPINKHGRFKAEGGGAQGQNGIEVDKAYVISGRFTSSTKAKGTVDVDYQRFDSSGRKIGECKTGSVTFAATR